MQSFALLLAAAAWAHPPLYVELDEPTRLSAMQPVGTQAATDGATAGHAQYQPFWSEVPLEFDAACFAVHSGSSAARTHELAVLSVGADGRPGDLLCYSDPILVPSSGAYCATFTDTDGTVVEPGWFVSGRLALGEREPIWVGFYASSGAGSVWYYVANPTSSLSLGQAYPGGPQVRHLAQSFTGWSSNPGLSPVSSGKPVLVSLQVAAP